MARQRTDLIQEKVLQKLKNSLVNSTAQKIVQLGNKFLAHAASADSDGSLAFSGIKLSDVDEVQGAFVRVERAITDCILFIAMLRMSMIKVRELFGELFEHTHQGRARQNKSGS